MNHYSFKVSCILYIFNSPIFSQRHKALVYAEKNRSYPANPSPLHSEIKRRERKILRPSFQASINYKNKDKRTKFKQTLRNVNNFIIKKPIKIVVLSGSLSLHFTFTFCLYCSLLNFLPRASSKIMLNYFQLY